MVKSYALPQSTFVGAPPPRPFSGSRCPVFNRADRYNEPALSTNTGRAAGSGRLSVTLTYYGQRGLMDTHERRATESAPRSFVSSAIFCVSITSPAARSPSGTKHHLQTCRPVALSSSMLVWTP